MTNREYSNSMLTTRKQKGKTLNYGPHVSLKRAMQFKLLGILKINHLLYFLFLFIFGLFLIEINFAY